MAVVIPNWNGAAYLRPCLAALVGQTLWPAFEVIVVDGASTDESAAVVAAFSGVRMLPLAENRGFARAVNAGIAATEADTIVLLNNDTVPEPRWLAELVAGLHAAPRAGMATSKVLTMDSGATIHTTGDTVDVAGRPANRGVWEEDEGQWDRATSVFGASGAAGAYRRALFDAVGLFAEDFGSYLEDVDLAWRARLAGFGCVFVPTAVVRHHVSATGGGPVASYLVARNRVWLLARCYPAALLRTHGAAVLQGLFKEALSAVGQWRGASARATLRGLAVGALTWPRMLPARRRIMAHKTVGDAAFEALLLDGCDP